MQKYNFVEISSILHCQTIPQGLRIKLENHFSQLETTKPPEI